MSFSIYFFRTYRTYYESALLKFIGPHNKAQWQMAWTFVAKVPLKNTFENFKIYVYIYMCIFNSIIILVLKF